MAIVLFRLSGAGSWISGIAFAEALFASPIIIAYLVSIFLKYKEDLRVMLAFEMLFCLFSAATFCVTFTGEHDARYQLALFIIPLVGLPAVAIAGLIAIFGHIEKRRLDKRGS